MSRGSPSFDCSPARRLRRAAARTWSLIAVAAAKEVAIVGAAGED
jgi:hypothetical protein